uniref:MAK10-like protein n=1 Tax=Tanacetum cinerariifolium TaxID=118510 RepID=A0A699HJI4_TANCI|nr:MAK10-like protein [Tanacetum cinerariifolium]
MGDENPIRTLEDYSKPSHKGYRNTIELPGENNMVPRWSNTIRLVQNGCSFHGHRSKDPNQPLKDFLKLMDSLDLDVENKERTRLRLFQFSLRDQASNWLEHLPARSISTWEDLTTGKLRDRNAKESWALLEDLALYDNKSWNDPRDCAKPVKAISLPQDVSSTSDHRLVELKNQVQHLMEAYLAPKLVSNFMASQDVRLSKFKANFKQQQGQMTNKIDTVLKAITDRITRALPSDTVKNTKINVNPTSPVLYARSYPTKDPQCSTLIHSSIKAITICPKQPNKSYDDKSEEEERKEKSNSKNIDTTPPSPPNPYISFIMKKVHTLNSFLESSSLVPQSSNTKFVYTKGDDEDIMFIEIIRKYDDSLEGLREDKNAAIGGL